MSREDRQGSRWAATAEDEWTKPHHCARSQTLPHTVLCRQTVYHLSGHVWLLTSSERNSARRNPSTRRLGLRGKPLKAQDGRKETSAFVAQLLRVALRNQHWTKTTTEGKANTHVKKNVHYPQDMMVSIEPRV